MRMMLELYPTILNEVVELRLGRRLRLLKEITNDEMDRLTEQIREEVLQEQRYWNEKQAKKGNNKGSLDRILSGGKPRQSKLLEKEGNDG